MNPSSKLGNTRKRAVIFLIIFILLLFSRLLFLPIDSDTERSNKNHLSNVDKKPSGFHNDFPLSKKPAEDSSYFLTVRHFLAKKIETIYPYEEANLVKGLLLGINDFPNRVKEDFINTGTIHVVVVSGYNVSLVAGAILTSTVFLGRKIGLSLSFLGIVPYTLLTGAQPPAVRAAIMGSLAFSASSLGRQKASLELLFLAAGIMLVWDPTLINSLSFQLSVLATLGVIYFTPKFEGKLAIFGPLQGDLANTLAAQILVTPLLLLNFGQVSWISPLVNLLILWTVPIATVLGFLSLIISLVINPLGQIIGWFNYLFLTYFLNVVNIFATLPVLKLPIGNFLIVIGYCLILASLLMMKKKRGEDDQQV